MSLSDSQVKRFLDLLDEKIEPLKKIIENEPTGMTNLDMLQTAHESGKLLGILQVKYALIELIKEDGNVPS